MKYYVHTRATLRVHHYFPIYPEPIWGEKYLKDLSRSLASAVVQFL
jgi:hypothetical protein